MNRIPTSFSQLKWAASLICAAVGFSAQQAVALPLITTPYINFENRSANTLGLDVGQFLRFGANSVVPNGLAGTTGSVTSSDGHFQFGVGFVPAPIIPNLFSRNVPLSVFAGATGTPVFDPWTLTFSNAGQSAGAVLQMTSTSAIAPFVNNVTLSGSSSAPTFSWTPPANVPVNGYRINIYDKGLINRDPANGPVNLGIVYSQNLQPQFTSFTVQTANIQVPGYQIASGGQYTIEISLIQTRDGSSNNLGNGNLASAARVYADFTPGVGGNLAVNLPVTQADGSYKFDMTVQEGATYHIDPLVAVGYDYQIGSGNPNFRSVSLPLAVGDGHYDLWGRDSSGNFVLLADNWMGGQVFDFGVGGTDWFRVTDIETSAGLDPANATAFVTALTFAGQGVFTGTQTPITVNVSDGQTIPEPESFALVLVGLLGMKVARRRKAAGST